MYQRDEIVGRRIANVFCDSSLSDESLNFCDFVYVIDARRSFRMPFDDGTGDLLQHVAITEKHSPATCPRWRWWHYHRLLWRARITDILVPADRESRFPDTGIIALSSGWFLAQSCGGPMGIAPTVDIMARLNDDEPMVSIWANYSA